MEGARIEPRAVMTLTLAVTVDARTILPDVIYWPALETHKMERKKSSGQLIEVKGNHSAYPAVIVQNLELPALAPPLDWPIQELSNLPSFFF